MLELPTILTADSLLDKAFGRAAKATAKGPDRAARARNLGAMRVRVAGETIASTLRGYVAGFPSLDDLPPFYREIVDILVDRGKLKRHIAAADWAAGRATEISREYRRRIGRATGPAIGTLRREAYGRLSSIVNQVGSDLESLVEARRAFRRLPQIDPNVPTIVVAGYPNVGKSSFVRAVSTGRPKVAEYPFTTKAVSLGHIEREGRRYQILDTPGILDRPMAERNRMERQAIAALTHLAGGVLFLLDPSESCGYPLDAQLRLLEEIRGLFPSLPLVVVAAKADLDSPTLAYRRVSARTGQGLREVMDVLLGKVTSRGPADAPRRAAP